MSGLISLAANTSTSMNGKAILIIVVIAVVLILAGSSGRGGR